MLTPWGAHVLTTPAKKVSLPMRPATEEGRSKNHASHSFLSKVDLKLNLNITLELASKSQ